VASVSNTQDIFKGMKENMQEKTFRRLSNARNAVVVFFTRVLLRTIRKHTQRITIDVSGVASVSNMQDIFKGIKENMQKRTFRSLLNARNVASVFAILMFLRCIQERTQEINFSVGGVACVLDTPDIFVGTKKGIPSKRFRSPLNARNAAVFFVMQVL